MDEEIIVSPMSNVFENRSYSRRKFYDERLGGNVKTDLAVHVVSILLFGTDGELILQKRAEDKRHNQGLIDKTLGGHINYGDSDEYTMMVETVQELLTPSVVLDNEVDFDKTLSILKPYLDTIAVVYKKTVRPWTLNKTAAGRIFPVNNIVHLAFGVYAGRMRPADKEASGILYYNSLEQLEKEIAAHPDIFTDDLIQLVKEYRDEILQFQAKIKMAKTAP
jgi:isopentenyldiphosphate isomerase